MNPEYPRERRRSFFQNWISVLGGISSIFLFSVIVFLFILDIFSRRVNPYLGAVTYFILPLFLIGALLAIPLGAVLERRRRFKKFRFLERRKQYREAKEAKQIPLFPQIDFNQPRHQKIAYIALGIISLFLLFVIYATYRAYEFTESRAFCGQLCHVVMFPEFAASQTSPHARVACSGCHIGPGAEWYFRSKLSGTRQMFAVLADHFPRPIKTPIKNLRPARETCEECHWSRQDYETIEKDRRYFLSDEKNSEWQTRLRMFVGGGKPSYAGTNGIHWHINPENKIYYVATDEKRQVIPWFKKVDKNGKEEIYVEEKSKFSATRPPQGEMRLMDCMDCHNRPTHNFRSPMQAVNDAIASGSIDRSLAYIKREAVKALIKEYPSHEAASKKIRASLQDFYQKNYPAVRQSQKAAIEEAANILSEIYRTNFFPEMKVSWKVYPENTGHLISPGCFRCHDGKHKTAEGKVLSNDCVLCHNITAQGPPQALELSPESIPFKHPTDIGDMWKEGSCSDCHTGGAD